MNNKIRTYYMIRFTEDYYYSKKGDYYSSRNGTDKWNDIKAVKGILKRGIPSGYKGRNSFPFEHYEVVKVTEIIETTTEIVDV